SGRGCTTPVAWSLPFFKCVSSRVSLLVVLCLIGAVVRAPVRADAPTQAPESFDPDASDPVRELIDPTPSLEINAITASPRFQSDAGDESRGPSIVTEEFILNDGIPLRVQEPVNPYPGWVVSFQNQVLSTQL